MRVVIKLQLLMNIQLKLIRRRRIRLQLERLHLPLVLILLPLLVIRCNLLGLHVLACSLLEGHMAFLNDVEIKPGLVLVDPLLLHPLANVSARDALSGSQHLAAGNAAATLR